MIIEKLLHVKKRDLFHRYFKILKPTFLMFLSFLKILLISLQKIYIKIKTEKITFYLVTIFPLKNNLSNVCIL